MLEKAAYYDEAAYHDECVGNYPLEVIRDHDENCTTYWERIGAMKAKDQMFYLEEFYDGCRSPTSTKPRQYM